MSASPRCFRKVASHSSKTWYKSQPWNGNQQSPPIKLAGLVDYRPQIKEMFDSGSVDFYLQLAHHMCPNLQFNADTQEEISEQLKINGIPRHVSVGFHIRRGDKVAAGESPAYAAETYVQKLLAVSKRISRIETCFLATDDASVVGELQAALTQHQVRCQLYTLMQQQPTQSSPVATNEWKKMSQSVSMTIPFLAEMSMLIRASVFIGTFNSNLGTLVSILRSCDAWGEVDEKKGRLHFSQSYGVDQENWFFY